MRLGVDIGGTFTDVVLQLDDGTFRTWKVASTPPNFSEGVLAGIELVADALGMGQREFMGALTEFVHGTTVTTNVVLTRTGDRVGLLTTRGFGDTYGLARQYRGHEQDPALVTHPTPLVPREDVEEVDERVDYRGKVLVDLDEEGLRAAVTRLLDKGIRSFAICFLWSFVNPVHEQRAKRIVLELCPDAYLAASFEACPVMGEYERTSTSVITAFAGPALRRYAGQLESKLRELGFTGSLLLMKSDGGLGSIEAAVRAAGQTVYSGPAAGVMAARALAGHIGQGNLITFDMGGTSTDVAIMHNGTVRSTSLQFLERQALATPTIDITTVGAGGGSIGWRAADGTLRVGPQSSGADPGPACYGRGGEEPSVSDANLLLGLLPETNFLGGRLTLDSQLAEHAIHHLCASIGLAPLDAAHGMYRVANAVMADAIRLRTVFAGLDPREFTLVSFGGAGGLHCAAVATELGIRTVVIPRRASVFSALGLVSTDVTYGFARSDQRELGPDGRCTDEGIAEMNAIFAELEQLVDEALAPHGISRDRVTVTHTIELAYRRQILNFEVSSPRRLSKESLAAVVADFEHRYRTVYGPGAAAPEHGYSVKTFRVTGIGGLARPPIASVRSRAGDDPVPTGHRIALADVEHAELIDVPVYDGEALRAGQQLTGPAIVEYADTTVLVPMRSTASLDEYENLHLQIGATA